MDKSKSGRGLNNGYLNMRKKTNSQPEQLNTTCIV